MTSVLALFLALTAVGRFTVHALSDCACRRSFLLKQTGFALSSLGVATASSSQSAAAAAAVTLATTTRDIIRPIPRQYVAALGDPLATHGSGADQWGLWTVDPGPRGVRLEDFANTLAKTQRGPYGWNFDPNDWWLEEHGIITERPDFPITAGKYQVTGGREQPVTDDDGDERQGTTILSIQENGEWSLEEGNLYDVTHQPCRSARYTSPAATGGGGRSTNAKKSCTPSRASAFQFPVRPGAAMPSVSGCKKQDYAVLFITGKVIGS